MLYMDSAAMAIRTAECRALIATHSALLSAHIAPSKPNPPDGYIYIDQDDSHTHTHIYIVLCVCVWRILIGKKNAKKAAVHVITFGAI